MPGQKKGCKNKYHQLFRFRGVVISFLIRINIIIVFYDIHLRG